jgi:carboxyl-terminal processing protease
MIRFAGRWKKNSRTIIITGLICTSVFFFIASSDKDFKIAKYLDIFVTLFREVDLYYVDEKDPEDLINKSIEGMLGSLDPYTTFIPESDMDEFQFMTTGQYGGIGALIRKGGNYIIISEPYEGFPAQKAGLRAGDTLFSVNGISTKGKTVSIVSEMLKGTPNTELKLLLQHGNNSPAEKIFKREKITIKNVPYYGFVDKGVGYIQLGGFTKDAVKEVRKAFTGLKEKGATSIIIDLRGNPGGLLNESVEIANIWIKKGQEIVSTRGKSSRDSTYRTSFAPIDTTISLAVLVNRGSASASEILAGSLQDLDRAIIVGERTFGKGLVQTTRSLSYKTYLKITTAKYYIPSGRCIQALDYSHRNEDGSVGYVPDSLISEFKTKNGRLVYDGGGIRPDVDVAATPPSNITISLYLNNLLFDYATLFALNHDSITGPGEFEISDKIYNDFLSFLSNKSFDYNTQSNDKLDELITTAKREGYYSIAKNEIEALRIKLSADKNIDLLTFSQEIKNLLREEIVSRYYYQTGRIIAELKNDEQLDMAIKLLNEIGTVNSILHGTYEAGDFKLAAKDKTLQN